jgi:hypothetical protein
MLYDVISFIQKNATTDEYDEGISKRLTEMMNTGKIQFDNIDERRGSQDLAGYWDGDRNTVTGQVRDIIVIDIERAISGGMEVLIDTLFHEGTHAYQFSLGLMNFDPSSEEEFIERGQILNIMHIIWGYEWQINIVHKCLA